MVSHIRNKINEYINELMAIAFIIVLSFLTFIFIVSSSYAYYEYHYPYNQAENYNKFFAEPHKSNPLRYDRISINSVADVNGKALHSLSEVTAKRNGVITKVAVGHTITKAIGKNMLAIAAIEGGLILGEMYIDYLLSQGGEDLKKTDGYIYKTIQQPVGGCPNHPTVVDLGAFNDSKSVLTACSNYKGATWPECPLGWQQVTGNCGNGFVWQGFTRTDPGTCQGLHVFGYYLPQGAEQSTIAVDVPAETEDIEELTDHALENDTENALNHLSDVVDKLAKAINDANDPLRSTDPTLNSPGGAIDTLNKLLEKLTNALNSGDADTIDEKLTDGGDTPEQITNNQTNYTQYVTYNYNIDETTVKNGVKSAMTDLNQQAESENLTAMPDLPITEEADDKGTIAPIIDDFMTGMESLPIISFFTGLKNTAFTGSCAVSIAMVNPWTQTNYNLSMSFCPYEDVLAFIGSVLLAVCGIVWIMYLFEG